MSKTGGGRGTNQYAVKGVSRARAQDSAVLDDLAKEPELAECTAGRVQSGCVHLSAPQHSAGSDLSHLEPDALRHRIEALVPLTEYGPNYNRGVAEALQDARKRIATSASWPPDLAAAHAAVMEAEVAANRRSVDDLAAYRNGGWDADVAFLRQRTNSTTSV